MKLFDRTRLPSILVLTALIAAVVTTSSFQQSHLAWSRLPKKDRTHCNFSRRREAGNSIGRNHASGAPSPTGRK